MSTVPVVSATPAPVTPTPPAAASASEQAASAAAKVTGGKEPDSKPENPVTEAAKEAARKLKIKFEDGKEEEVDENEVVSVYKQRKGHQRAASKELQEGKAARKQAEEFINMMRDPEKFYEAAKKLGHDPRKLSEKYLTDQITDELMDPRDRELRDTKRELDHMKRLDQEQKDALKTKRDAVLKEKYAADYNTQFVAALQETGLPGNAQNVADMAKYVARAAGLGFKMTALEAAKMVDQDLEQIIRHKTKGSDAEVLLRLFGEDVANKIRQHDVSRLKNPEQGLEVNEKQELRDRGARKSETKRMTTAEWRAFNRK